ncbi:MAG: tRNA uridine-5-carboxymethylaminomethyl(34) synthesis GTPase MnmE, partial [Alphaproteobacteria bacterium]|nr:tRNA uridine-5-carboxymethylaminomethyl(34) synthesis GTPase MnmE [Alphaproteobacteria bacterium]
MSRRQTIFALSSARGRAGVCVFRVSGPQTDRVIAALTSARLPAPRQAVLRAMRFADGAELDRGLLLWFPGPHSFTGEDVAEFHLHGGPAIIAAMTRRLGEIDGVRPADPGEFTRRAFANGKLDLTEAEGLADLIAAETEQQRRLALRQTQGALKQLYERWRAELVHALALLEASIDFADEELPDDLLGGVAASVARLSMEIAAHLADHRRGEIVRHGFTVVILGAPNVGKSSLLNALVRREAAIVSAIPGTTRDPIEVDLDLAGYAVTLIDTAGLRDTGDTIENEGIKRAKAKAQHADLRLAVIDGWIPRETDSRVTSELSPGDAVLINKSDLLGQGTMSPISSRDGTPLRTMRLSALTGEGIDELLAWLEAEVVQRAGGSESMPMTRARHREALQDVHSALLRAPGALAVQALDLAAEDLRIA